MVARAPTQRASRVEPPWVLLGVHAIRMDIANRDVQQDEHLDLNCARCADILLTLTQHPAAG